MAATTESPVTIMEKEPEKPEKTEKLAKVEKPDEEKFKTDLAAAEKDLNSINEKLVGPQPSGTSKKDTWNFFFLRNSVLRDV